MGAEQSTNQRSIIPTGGSSSTGTSQQHSSNDYQLVIQISRELEGVLETEFGAKGRGLHEKIGSVESELTPQLVKRMRYLATIRNKLIHQANTNGLPDRGAFIRAYDLSKGEMTTIVERRRQAKANRGGGGYQQTHRQAGNNDSCAIL